MLQSREINYSRTRDITHTKRRISVFVTYPCLKKKKNQRSWFYLLLEKFASLLFTLLNLFPSRPSSFPGSLGMNISPHIAASARHYLLTSGTRCHRSLPHAETVFSWFRLCIAVHTTWNYGIIKYQIIDLRRCNARLLY